MKIVIFHPTLLPPKDYGGVERVVLWLAKGLAELGHDVTVGALAGSRMPEGVKLLAFEPDAVSAHELLRRLPPGTDVVHFQAPPEAGVLDSLPCGGVLTVHGNGKPGEVFPRNTVFLSADHARRHGASAHVHNGIDPAEYRFDPRAKEDWVLFLSKTSWRVKNVAGAVSLCARAGVPLRVAGGNRPLRTRARVALHEWGLPPRMRWVGPVAQAAKADLLAAARAMVFPVRWPEPFGLVVAEALISGTPVIASRLGSLPELVDDSVGALFDLTTASGREGMIDALSRVHRGDHEWSPEVCREHAMARFHYSVMAKRYESVYGQVAAGQYLHEKEPRHP